MMNLNQLLELEADISMDEATKCSKHPAYFYWKYIKIDNGLTAKERNDWTDKDAANFAFFYELNKKKTEIERNTRHRWKVIVQSGRKGNLKYALIPDL